MGGPARYPARVSNGENTTAEDGPDGDWTAGSATDSEAEPPGRGGVGTGTFKQLKPGRLGLLRRRRWAILSTAVTVLAAAFTVPVLAGEDDAECRQVPAEVRDLADAPAAATKALDPGEDLAGLDEVSSILAHEQVCGDGARVLGQVVGAATGAAGTGELHTEAQARSAYAVVAVLTDVELPDGLAPGVARMLADYIVDTARGHHRWISNDAHAPALPASAATLDDDGYTRMGRFLAPQDAYAVFGHENVGADADPRIEDLIAELAKDPAAFAVLYDAERAYFAYYLERLTREGGDPARRPSGAPHASTSTTWPDHDLQDLGGRIGALMKHRARYARDGTIPDLAAFDAAVRRHTRGTFRPAPRRSTTREPMGRIAERPASGPVRGPLMDGRYQLFRVLDRWTADRDVPRKRAAAMRQLLDDGYVRGLWHIV